MHDRGDIQLGHQVWAGTIHSFKLKLTRLSQALKWNHFRIVNGVFPNNFINISDICNFMV